MLNSKKCWNSSVFILPDFAGASGPHPRLSTGALALQVISMPSFIDMFGTQKVRFEKGCWEMVWKKDQHCGSIICGFEVPNGAKRNGANLPAGRLYLSFPVWTQGGLSVRQEERTHAEAKVKEFSQEKDDELRKMEATSNLFMKAVHYRNAVAAVEKIDMSGIRFLSQIPLENEVMPIGDGILMNTKGTIWNKDNNFLGAKHSLLGEAILSPYVEDQIQTDVLKPWGGIIKKELHILYESQIDFWLAHTVLIEHTKHNRDTTAVRTPQNMNNA